MLKFYKVEGRLAWTNGVSTIKFHPSYKFLNREIAEEQVNLAYWEFEAFFPNGKLNLVYQKDPSNSVWFSDNPTEEEFGVAKQFFRSQLKVFANM